MNPLSYAHFIFDKDAKNMMKKWHSLQQMSLGKVSICLQKTETRSRPVTLTQSGLRTLISNWEPCS
jgi:hypothetical protein